MDKLFNLCDPQFSSPVGRVCGSLRFMRTGERIQDDLSIPTEDWEVTSGYELRQHVFLWGKRRKL